MSSLPLRQKERSSQSVFLAAEAGNAIYQSGAYLETHPSWHVEESPFKVRQVLRMLKRHPLELRTLCDIGCGAGAVLAELQQYLPANCICWGFDVSPDAIAMATGRASHNLRFRLHDIRRDACTPDFDLLLVLDVFEHVDDYIGLLRDIRAKGKYKIFHIPLDISVQAVARRDGLLRRRDEHAHLHYFTKETALRTLRDIGYSLIDFFYTPRCIELGDLLAQKIARIPRRMCFAAAPDLTVRFFGGYSLMVMAE
jgi:SAM-dependent methyltransferase